VERRTYFPPPVPVPSELRRCPACGQPALSPWYLHRDRDRRVWRRWVCLACHRYQDLPEDESA